VAHDGVADVEADCLLGVDGRDRGEDGGLRAAELSRLERDRAYLAGSDEYPGAVPLRLGPAPVVGERSLRGRAGEREDEPCDDECERSERGRGEYETTAGRKLPEGATAAALTSPLSRCGALVPTRSRAPA
jgi:hypothetical protein